MSSDIQRDLQHPYSRNHEKAHRYDAAVGSHGKMKVFILGSPRTGTSITYYALREVFDLPGRGESHVMPVFQRMLHMFFLHAREFAPPRIDLAGQLNPRDFRNHLAAYIRRFYAANYPEGRFVDKTPGAEAITGIRLIRDAFPDARVIITRRSGIEVVQSVRRKFSSDFDDACELWTRCMAAMEMARPECPDVFEIDQFDLANSPTAVSQRLCAYLGSSDKCDLLARFFLEQRTDQSSRHDWRSRLTLAEVQWTDEQKATFVRICGAHMEAAGYPM
jgi:hypothetical protein